MDYAVDLENLVIEVKDGCLDSQSTISTITQSQVDAARALFAKSKVWSWEESYRDEGVFDSWGFSLDITYQDGSTQSVYAYHIYPPRWGYLVAGLRELGITHLP